MKLLQMRFFLKKQQIKFLCTYWSILLCKINKETWEQIQSLEDTIPFLLQNDQIAVNKISLRKTINITRILSWPLSLCKIVKQSLQWIQSCEAGCDIVGPKWPIYPKQEFFRISH